MEENIAQSEYNMSFASFNRINYSFWKCNVAAEELDSFTWLHHLTILRRELSCKMKAAEREEFKRKIPIMNNLVMKELQFQQRTGKREISTTLWNMLDQYDEDLRMVADKAGILFKSEKDARHSIG